MTITKSREELLKEAQAMPFRSLPEVYSVTGAKYRLHKRGEKGAIYINDEIGSCEVFKIKVAKATVVMGNPTPARERTPGNEDFGVWAWCPNSLERAEKIFEEIETGQRDADIVD